jgi:predicted transcriptional regulator
MKYRGKIEIFDAMLRSIGSGSAKTRIMYKAYLSHTQLQEYLALLQKRNLIEYEEKSQRYRLTEKGIRFIDAYDQINELILSTDERNEILRRESEVEFFPDNQKAK